MAVTIRDIAKAAGVSVATVSRVVGDYGYVSKEKRELVQKHIEELRYTPNNIARSMIKKRTNTIGLIVADIHDPFYIDLLDAIEGMANDKGYSVLICNSNESPKKEVQNVNTLIERMIDGIVMVPLFENFEQYNKQAGKKQKKILPYQHILDLNHHKIPFVFIDRNISDINADVIMLDNINTTFKAMSSLIEKGNSNIFIVVGLDNQSSSKERIAGVKQACAKHNYELPKENWINCKNTAESAYDEVKKALDRKKCDAIFTLDNNMTIGALKAINDKKLEINKDIYLLGFDDIHLYNLLIPENIGVIHQPVQSLCKFAIDMLFEKIEKEELGGGRVVRLEGEIKE